MEPTNISYPVSIENHSQLTNLVLNLLAFSGAKPNQLTLNDEPLEWDELDEELLSLLEDGTIQEGFYIYWEQDSDLISILTHDEWETSDAEDETDYTYHTFIASYDGTTMEINLAIN